MFTRTTLTLNLELKECNMRFVILGILAWLMLTVVYVGNLRRQVIELDKTVAVYKERGYVSLPFFVDPNNEIGDLAIISVGKIGDAPERFVLFYGKVTEIQSIIQQIRVHQVTASEREDY